MFCCFDYKSSMDPQETSCADNIKNAKEIHVPTTKINCTFSLKFVPWTEKKIFFCNFNGFFFLKYQDQDCTFYDMPKMLNIVFISDRSLVVFFFMNKEWVESYWEFHMPQLILKARQFYLKYFTVSHCGKPLPILNTVSCSLMSKLEQILVNKYIEVGKWGCPHPIFHTPLMPTDQAGVWVP